MKGVGNKNTDFSLRDIRNLAWQYMREKYAEEAVSPEVHSPDQRGGDIANVEVFPNAGYKPVEVTSRGYKVLGQLIGHTDHVDCVAWSPDGKFIASGSYDNTIRIWDVHARQCIRVLGGHSLGISDLAWNPTGSTLGSASYDKTVRLWNIDTWECKHVLAEHSHAVRCIDWAHNGRFIVSGSSDCKIEIWDGFNGRKFRSYVARNEWINAVAFQPSDALVAIGLGGGDVALYSPATGSIQSIKASLSYVNSVAWMPHTGHLCSGSGSGSIRLWDIKNPKPVKELKEHRDKILRVRFSPDGRLLASLGQDRQIIWNCQEWKPLHTIEGPFPTSTYLPLAFASSGPLLATTDVANPTVIQLVQLDF